MAFLLFPPPPLPTHVFKKEEGGKEMQMQQTLPPILKCKLIFFSLGGEDPLRSHQSESSIKSLPPIFGHLFHHLGNWGERETNRITPQEIKSDVPFPHPDIFSSG